MAEKASTQVKPSATKSPMQTSSGGLQRKCACGQHTIGGGNCAACSGEKTILSREANGQAAPAGVPPSVRQVLSSPGQPLNGSLRSFMESRFDQRLGDARVSSAGPHIASAPCAIGPAGDRFEQEADRTADAVMRSTSPQASARSANGGLIDFSHVRVHNDERAARSADEIGALAFTAGTHIVFGLGQFAPETSAGRQLLAHELTHVVQQGGRSALIQRQVAEQKPCAVHAYDKSHPGDTEIIPKTGGIGVTSVKDMVTNVNAYVDDPKNNCRCINRLEINGHGKAGYQSVGNGVEPVLANQRALAHDSKQEDLNRMLGIKFCNPAILMLLGCHTGGSQEGKKLLSRLSALLPGILIGGAQHYTTRAGLGQSRVLGGDDKPKKGGWIEYKKTASYLTSPYTRWYITTKKKQYVINGANANSASGKAMLKVADKIIVELPDGEKVDLDVKPLEDEVETK